MGALATALMLLGGILPLATFCAPAFAGLLIMPVAIEYGNKTGTILYIAIGLLSLFVVADKEMALIFIFFLGYYPLLKTQLEKIAVKLIKFTAKLAVFNFSIISMYLVVLLLFPMGIISQELDITGIFLVVLLVLANITFIIYDVAVARIVGLYCTFWRSKLMKMH